MKFVFPDQKKDWKIFLFSALRVIELGNLGKYVKKIGQLSKMAKINQNPQFGGPCQAGLQPATRGQNPPNWRKSARSDHTVHTW